MKISRIFEAALGCIKIFFAATILILVNGCSVFSGSTPLAVTATDRELINTAEEKIRFNVPLITYSIDNRPIKVYKVAFDGTLNDASRVPDGERETLVAHIAKRVSAYPDHYYPGPGMQNHYLINWLDAVFGYTSADIAEQAKQHFFKQAERWLLEEPSTEIRVFVTGFSRGSAVARHFMNIVEKDWFKSAAGHIHTTHTPRFYALLYDTVSTGQMALNLSIPASLDYMVHMVAIDEPRSLFKPVIDVDDYKTASTEIFNFGKSFSPQRINLLFLPGSHSDVGASYGRGIGDIYRSMSEQLLYKMGLLNQNCWEETQHALDGGKHDSRGFFDKLSGSTAPNSERSVERSYYSVRSAARSDERDAEISARLARLSLANAERQFGVTSIQTKTASILFKLMRNGENIKILGYEPSLIDRSSFKFYFKDGYRRLDYRFNTPLHASASTIVLFDEIWDRLPEGEEATLSYSILQSGGRTILSTYVNNTLVKTDSANIKPGIQLRERQYDCQNDENGKPVSPIKTFILSAPDSK